MKQSLHILSNLSQSFTNDFSIPCAQEVNEYRNDKDNGNYKFPWYG